MASQAHYVEKVHIERPDSAVDFSIILSELAKILVAPLAIWDEYWRRRIAFRRLAQLDERMLKDIGLRHTDLLLADQLPLSVNATAHLRHTKAYHAG